MSNPLSSALRPYSNVASGEVELQALRSSSDTSAQLGPLGPPQRRRWLLPTWRELQQPRVQGRLWIAAACLILVLAVAVFAATRAPWLTGSSSEQQQAAAAAPPGSRASAVQPVLLPEPFPQQPWLAPSGACGEAAASSLGPQQPPHSPLAYRLRLSFEPGHFLAGAAGAAAVAAGFRAQTNITLAVHQETSCLTLHASNLSFSHISAAVISGSQQQEQQQQQEAAAAPVCLCGAEQGCAVVSCGRLFKASPAGDAWLLSLGSLVAPAGSTLLLTTDYTARFHGRTGMWRSAPFASSSPSQPTPGQEQQQVVLLNTEFETQGARLMLPCMDEPRFKATFVVLVDAPDDLAALSNMPEASRSIIDGGAEDGYQRVLTEFLPTPVMSTYLLSVAVGDIQKAAAGRTASGTAVRVWTAPGAAWREAARMPLQLATGALEHYQSLTNISQPLPKFDLVAVPGKTGAVENWGLVMFDAARLLYRTPGAWTLFRSANVICHELAHQWFGNLVTAEAWPDLLVNEGLATLVEYGCMARVLPQQLGPAGAAALMRHVAAPHGNMPRVHEGPLSKALLYDASPTADALLGSGTVDFGVVVYSKAASALAMVGSYAASAAAADHGAAPSLGPVEELTGRSPPGTVQVALQQHLRAHIFGVASAHDVLARFLQLTPSLMSSSTVAVISGWQAPGSPLLSLAHTPEGLEVHQRRFCLWGLLEQQLLDSLLLGPDGQLPQAPSLPSNGSSPAASLTCPVLAADGDRAVPWTPVLVQQLQQPTGNGTTTSCSSWQVVMREKQVLRLPAGCASADSSAGALLVLGGDGGWGLFWVLHPPEQRAALRQWVQAALLQLLGSDGQRMGVRGSMQLLFIAAKAMADQVTLGLSSFGEVPGWEAFAALQAAAAAAAGAAGAAGTTAATAGAAREVGLVANVLLSPLLPLAEVLLDRLASNATCSLLLQARVAALLKPIAPAVQSLVTAATPGSIANGSYPSPEHFLAAMSLSGLLTATAMADEATAAQLCGMFNTAAAAAASGRQASGALAGSVDAQVLLASIHPDLQDSVLNTAAAQPAGCRLDMPGLQLLQLLQSWHLTAQEPVLSQRAAFAIAHYAARPAPVEGAARSSSGSSADAPAAEQLLAWLLGLPPWTPAAPACGIPASFYAAELAVEVSRALSRQNVRHARAAAAGQLGPVLLLLTQHWAAVTVAVGGEPKAWPLLQQVAGVEVLGEQDWRLLAAWAAQQHQQQAQEQQEAEAARHAKQLQAVLGAAWSNVVWIQQQQADLCGRLG